MRTWEEIEAYAKSLGFTLAVDQHAHTMEIGLIIRPESAPPGTGAEIMQGLCNLADDTNRAIGLDVGSNEPKLILYYERFGFYLTGRHTRGIVEMRREPR